mmetsp:Transcript_17555/g.45210  ORF Transcript_17555/g.45210 Transcript_17555/m.45210 type:complete len:331 (+) Transcript_17555:653-1645(+)
MKCWPVSRMVTGHPSVSPHAFRTQAAALRKCTTRRGQACPTIASFSALSQDRGPQRDDSPSHWVAGRGSLGSAWGLTRPASPGAVDRTSDRGVGAEDEKEAPHGEDHQAEKHLLAVPGEALLLAQERDDKERRHHVVSVGRGKGSDEVQNCHQVVDDDGDADGQGHRREGSGNVEPPCHGHAAIGHISRLIHGRAAACLPHRVCRELPDRVQMELEAQEDAEQYRDEGEPHAKHVAHWRKVQNQGGFLILSNAKRQHARQRDSAVQHEAERRAQDRDVPHHPYGGFWRQLSSQLGHVELVGIREDNEADGVHVRVDGGAARAEEEALHGD